MNKEIYEKNIESIRKKYESWADFIEEEKYKKSPLIYVDTDKSIDGQTIFRVSYSGKLFYLNGKYNPSYAGEDWLEQQGQIEDFATVVIVGIHDTIHIRNILKNVKKTTNILIYEPSIEVFVKALEEVDLSFLFEEDVPIGILVDQINDKEKKIFLQRMITYDSMTMLKVYISGNYEKLFTEKVEAFVEDIRKRVMDTIKNWNTIVRYTNVNAVNIFNNCKYMYDGYSIYSLYHILPPEVPTIVVSAGPSLNKNIQDLKAAVGKANIIATDTAMKPLLNAGIIPNFFVVVDGLKPGDLFRHKDISKVPMVTMNAISVEPMKIHKGKKFFYASDSELETEIMTRAIQKDKKSMGMPSLASGGSVATSAYSLGIYMGSKTIILVGQDLAMTGNKTHADGTFKEKMDTIDINSGEYFEVESVDGGKVLTRMDFKLYLDWFEEQIKEQSQIRVIDATEGGAKIHGSEIMTLKEAIEKECKKEFNVRYRVSRRPQMLGEVGKEEMLKILEGLPGKLIEVKKKAAAGVRQYERLEKLSKKDQYTKKELEKLLKQIGKTNKYIEEDYMAGIVIDSLKGMEYTLRPSIYRTKEDSQEEMHDIAQNGKVMLQAVGYAAEEILQLVEEKVIPFTEKQRQRNAKKAGKK